MYLSVCRYVSVFVYTRGKARNFEGDANNAKGLIVGGEYREEGRHGVGKREGYSQLGKVQGANRLREVLCVSIRYLPKYSK